ncbi:hypothetical protein K1719_009533 [Acacia pycnantha]|nr:hypothetical protein K1719_009533 [Acacia pycnantha]
MHELPFQVGQLAETRSRGVGFRGAWFRCKIRDIRENNGELSYRMRYVDYPGQKLEWKKVYRTRKNKDSELMVRPCYPTLYFESEKPDMSTISEEIVVVDGAWMVGDLVDFRADGCYWSGSVAKVLEDGKFKIDLFPPPRGEGSSYEAFFKDIRPSLVWDPKKGWTVPIPELPNVRNRRSCTQLRKPEHSDRDAVVQTSLISLQRSSHSPPSTEPLLDAPEGRITVNNAPCIHIRVEPAESIRRKEISDGLFNEQPSKKLRKDKNICLDSMFLHSIEDALLDLEELVNKVKWTKGLLEFGMPLSSRQSIWELKQHLA